jgi:NhaA family Na+:H+ antiporter
MVVPALIYVTINAGSPAARGWGIPMATDIAFAVAVLAVLGSRVPRGLKIFLLTLAIVDDIGAILVLAVFYSEGIAVIWLLGAVVALVWIVLMRRIPLASPLAYILPSVVLWICVLESGVHATIAGVILGLLTPARPVRGQEIIEPLEHRLHPLSSFVVVPLFALANAGVRLDGASLRGAATSAVAWGIVLGLVVGKPLGIMAATAFGLRFRVGRLPRDTRPSHLAVAGTLAGIGFTVSLFIASLSFTGAQLDSAKIAVLLASVTSALVGVVALLITRRRQPPPGAASDFHPPRARTAT